MTIQSHANLEKWTVKLACKGHFSEIYMARSTT